MSEQPIYRAIAAAIAAEGVSTQFVLMGDGNMHWATAMAELPGMKTIHVRHEHCAVAMAMGWQGAAGGIGVASVTCGPGFTQIMTALTQASRSRVPLVVFAGEVPVNAPWYGQTIDQRALALPTGADYIAIHTPRRVHQLVQQAFFVARSESRPVVLAMPYDLQKQPMPSQGDYVPSTAILPRQAPIPPDPAAVARLSDALARARRPVILAGRGVMAAEATNAVEALADATGALLATTLPARGLFDHNPFSIGISGGYAREAARELAAQADLVVSFGASLSSHTVDGGLFYGSAPVIQVDPNPLILNEAVVAASDWIRADARLTAEAVTQALAKLGQTPKTARSNAVAAQLARDVGDSSDQPVAPGQVDPRLAIDALDQAVPKHWDTVSGSGHQSYFHSVMRGRPPERYHVYKAFGAIGSGLSFATGVAVARGDDGGVVLFEGDGSLIMHVQELETIRRHGLKLLICVLNDGAYGSEIHKLRSDGLDDSGAIFGQVDFAAIARGFGLQGATVTDAGEIAAAVAAYRAGDTAMVMNILISDQVVTPRMRKTMARAGKGH